MMHQIEILLQQIDVELKHLTSAKSVPRNWRNYYDLPPRDTYLVFWSNVRDRCSRRWKALHRGKLWTWDKELCEIEFVKFYVFHHRLAVGRAYHNPFGE